MTPEQYQQWMQQWRRAAVELEQVRRAELSRMSDEEALQAAHDLLGLVHDGYRDPQKETYSGLAEQQRLLQKNRGI